MRRLLLLVTVLGACASSSSNECEVPPAVAYDCSQAIAPTCAGGPRWAEGLDAPARAFGVGCTATVPECSTFQPGTTRAFSCEVGPDGKPDWFESL